MPKLRQLKKYHKEAMEMKYRGVSYKDIAEKLTERFSKKKKRSFSDQTIKDWFKEGGTLLRTIANTNQKLTKLNARI